MSDDSVEVQVTLTRREVDEAQIKALTQGITLPEFFAFSVRAIAFGINYAISMLPNQGQVGTQDEQE